MLLYCIWKLLIRPPPLEMAKFPPRGGPGWGPLPHSMRQPPAARQCFLLIGSLVARWRHAATRPLAGRRWHLFWDPDCSDVESKKKSGGGLFFFWKVLREVAHSTQLYIIFIQHNSARFRHHSSGKRKELLSFCLYKQNSYLLLLPSCENLFIMCEDPKDKCDVDACTRR